MTAHEVRETGESEIADDLVASVRRLMCAAATTSRDDALLSRVRQQLDQISEVLELDSRLAVRRVPLDDERVEQIRAGGRWRMFPFNPLGIPQSIHVVDGVAVSRIGLGPLYEGPPGLVHGGFSAAVLDALVGVVVMAEVAPSFTARLDISYLRAMPLDGEIEARAWVTEVADRRILAEGAISQAGRVAVEARGVFVPMATPFVDIVAQARARADGAQSG